MRKKLFELMDQAETKCVMKRCVDCEYNGVVGCRAYNIVDHLVENGVIHIPCKVGDIVYQTDGVRIYELTILDIYLHKNKPYYETESVDFDDDAIGKSIFLTRQEAEARKK